MSVFSTPNKTKNNTDKSNRKERKECKKYNKTTKNNITNPLISQINSTKTKTQRSNLLNNKNLNDTELYMFR